MCSCATLSLSAFKQYHFRGLEEFQQWKVTTWTVSSEHWRITATVIHEESSSVCGQGELQWCLRVFYSPFWRRNSTRIAYVIVDNPTSSFDLYTTFTQVSGFSQWWFDGGSFPKSSFYVTFSRWFDFRSVTYNLALFSRGLLVPTFGVSLSSTLSSRYSPVQFRPDCPLFVSSLPLSFMCI